MVTVLVDLGAAAGGPTAVLVLAQDPAPPPGKGEEFGKASPIGLVVILLLLIATLFLIRSMTKHLRRVPASFDDPAEPAATNAARTDPDGAGPVAPRPADRDAVAPNPADVPPTPDR